MIKIIMDPKTDGVTEDCFNQILHTMTDAHFNGQPAFISGRTQRFPEVGSRTTRLGCEFSWKTVAHILNTTREFRS